MILSDMGQQVFIQALHYRTDHFDSSMFMEYQLHSYSDLLLADITNEVHLLLGSLGYG